MQYQTAAKRAKNKIQLSGVRVISDTAFHYGI